jgi:hypothetical protein
MKQSSVRGTPYHHVNATGGQGQRGGSPAENRGSTVHEEFRGDGINTQTRTNATPYRSERGNPPGARREVERSTNAESADHGNQNDPHSNGPTVMLDTHDAADGWMPREEGGVMDSPVPAHAPVFDAAFIPTEDRAHMGSGNESVANTNLVEIGGVMSRGTDSVSHPGEDEFELTRDDTLTKPEAGTQKDVQGKNIGRIRE